MLKLPHDFNDPRYMDEDGRLILFQPDKYKSEQVELVEGVHVIIDGDTFELEAVLELVETPTSNGLTDTWRARVVPGSFRDPDNETASETDMLRPAWHILRIGDMYSVERAKRDENSSPGITKYPEYRSRWNTYLFLRRQWYTSPDKIEAALNEADLAWYKEHKRRRERFSKHRV